MAKKKSTGKMKPANAKSLDKSPGKCPKGPAAKRGTLVDSKNDWTHQGATANSIFPIVGLGASAGGLEALEEFFLLTNCSFEDFEVQHDFPKLGHKKMLLNARRIESADGESGLILLAMEELK